MITGATTHWMVLTDADGETYGQLCSCEIGGDHTAEELRQLELDRVESS